MEKTVNNSGNANKDSFKNTPHVGGSANASANTGATGAKDSSGVASNMMNKASDTMSDMKNKISDQAAPAVDFLKNNFSTVSDKTQGYIQDAGSLVRRYPLYSLIGAVAIGTVVGMAISRSSSNRMA